MRICLASNNLHKINEIRKLLPSGIELWSLEDLGCLEELEEGRDTIEDNSLQKAEYVFNTYDVFCIADDTGLEVNALNGAPGVYSARYAGDEKDSVKNMALLLKNLEGKDDRSARFKTVISYITKDSVLQFEGIVKGEIIRTPRGEKGFGYDPVFIPEGYDLTFAEMSAEEKNRISHRGLAIQKLIGYLKDNYE